MPDEPYWNKVQLFTQSLRKLLGVNATFQELLKSEFDTPLSVSDLFDRLAAGKSSMLQETGMGISTGYIEGETEILEDCGSYGIREGLDLQAGRNLELFKELEVNDSLESAIGCYAALLLISNKLTALVSIAVHLYKEEREDVRAMTTEFFAVMEEVESNIETSSQIQALLSNYFERECGDKGNTRGLQ